MTFIFSSILHYLISCFSMYSFWLQLVRVFRQLWNNLSSNIFSEHLNHRLEKAILLPCWQYYKRQQKSNQMNTMGFSMPNYIFFTKVSGSQYKVQYLLGKVDTLFQMKLNWNIVLQKVPTSPAFLWCANDHNYLVTGT